MFQIVVLCDQKKSHSHGAKMLAKMNSLHFITAICHIHDELKKEVYLLENIVASWHRIVLTNPIVPCGSISNTSKQRGAHNLSMGEKYEQGMESTQNMLSS